MKTIPALLAALLLLTPELVFAAGITAPKSGGFQFTGQQIVDRLQDDMVHPARYTGLFDGPTKSGRVGSITNCKGIGHRASFGMYTCDITGVTVGTTANVQVEVLHAKVMSVILSVQNDISANSGLTAITAMMLEGAVVQAVDPLAQERGISNKTHEELIMAGLSPGPKLNLRRDVRADGLTFEQRMYSGDLVLDVHPTGGS